MVFENIKFKVKKWLFKKIANDVVEQNISERAVFESTMTFLHQRRQQLKRLVKEGAPETILRRIRSDISALQMRIDELSKK